MIQKMQHTLKLRTTLAIVLATALLVAGISIALILGDTTSGDIQPGISNTIDSDIINNKLMTNLATATVEVTGQSVVTKLSSELWDDAPEYECRTMTGKDSTITFTLSGLTEGKELTMEVEEIHQRTDSVLAYTITVNGKEIYFRTYHPSSDGQNHYFVPVDGALIGSDGMAVVTFKNALDSTVRFARIWGYSDMDEMLKAENVSRKMSVSLTSLNISYSSIQTDINRVNRIINKFGESDMYDVSFAVELPYMTDDIETLCDKLDYIMQLSARTGVTFRIGLNSWWGGTPSGPDGEGGFFSDITYHQVVYDPLNINGRGFWQLSTPNIWSNTPWLTMNNETYNQARAHRLNDAATYIQRRLAEYRIEGKQPSISIYMENEPLYWAYYAFNNSPNGSGDFNAAVIAAAQKDGITLDPEDGLSLEEKLWMYKNLNTYISEEGDVVFYGYQYDAVLVEDGITTLPVSQQIENAFTHMFVESIFPMDKENYGAWETHVISSLRYGGEWAGHIDDERTLDYIAALGKFANVNAERSSMNDYSLLLQAYYYGVDHVTIYNASEEDHNYFKEQGGKTQSSKQVASYENLILSYDFMDPSSFEINDVLVEIRDMKRAPLTDMYVAVPNNKEEKGGYLTFKIDNNGKGFDSGLIFQLDGRILYELNSSMKIILYAGNSLDDMKAVQVIQKLSSNRYDLSDYIDGSQSVVYVTLHCVATGLWEDWVAIYSVKAYSKWEQASGSLTGTEYTYEQLRNRNLFMGYRADVERLLQSYLDRAGKDSIYYEACSLYNDNKYVSAYKLLLGNLSETIPAKYIVKGHGKLGKYNIELELSNKTRNVYVELLKASTENYIFTLSSKYKLSLTVTFSGLTDGNYYRLNTIESGKFELVKTDVSDKAVLAVDGKASFTISLAAISQNKVLPSTFEARAYRNGSSNSIQIQAQDYRISDYANYITLSLASNCKVFFGYDGDSEEDLEWQANAGIIREGDYLKIKVNSNNQATEIQVYRGRVTGTVTAIKEVSLKGETANAEVTIQTADGTVHTFEIEASCALSFDGATGSSPGLAIVGNIGLTVGQEITVDYCPWRYNGRNPRAFAIS